MGIQERKDREKAEMRKMILTAAIQLFIQEGYESVTIRKIADRIEYSPGTIYTYFKDKDSIFYALHVEGFDMLYQKQLSIQGINDPRERLLAHGRAYIEFAIENPEYYDIMFVISGPQEIICMKEDWTQGQRSYDLLKRNVAECKAIGLFKDEVAEAVAFFLWSTVHGIASLLIRRGYALNNMYDQDSSAMIESSLKIMESILE